MKKILSAVSFMIICSACGNMSNNTNEQHTNYTDSSGMNPDEGTGTPNTSTAPLRDTFNTNAESSTNGPDNAPPVADSMKIRTQ